MVSKWTLASLPWNFERFISVLALPLDYEQFIFAAVVFPGVVHFYTGVGLTDPSHTAHLHSNICRGESCSGAVWLQRRLTIPSK
eukprot:3739726-Amphidinium_carterae.1